MQHGRTILMRFCSIYGVSCCPKFSPRHSSLKSKVFTWTIFLLPLCHHIHILRTNTCAYRNHASEREQQTIVLTASFCVSAAATAAATR